MKKIYLLLLGILFSIGSITAQCMLYPVSLQERVTNSQLIIEGNVISKKSFWNDKFNYVYTSNLIQVKQVLKGTVNSSFIEIITDGGIVENFKQEVNPALKLSENEEGVFMVNSDNKVSQFGHPVYQTYADEQGFIKFDLSDNSARDHFNHYLDINSDLYSKLSDLIGKTIPPFYGSNESGKFQSSASIAAISGFNPTTISAGTFSVLTITGSGFGTVQNASNYVAFKNADDGGATWIQPHSSQYISWTNTQIQVRVPTKTSGSGTAGTGQVRVYVNNSPQTSSGNLTVTYGHLNVLSSSVVYNTRHVDLNNNGGITWQMYTGFNSNTSQKNSFIRAFNTWRCNTYINWQLGAPTSVNTIASDGTNVVRMDIGTELPSGVLGRCTSYWNGCGSSPNQNWFVSELDIVFDSGTNWQYGPANATGSQFDFESVAVHELGHGHQLSHVINTAQVMHYSIGPAQNKRTLNVNEINGGNAVMTRNLSGGVCSKPVMVALAPSACSITVPTASFAVSTPVCAGVNVTFTNQSTSATNYTWTMTGGNPATSNLATPTTSYSTPGVKTITLVTSNGMGNSTPYTKTVSIIAAPTVAVTNATVCPNTPTTLTASGASSYTWNPGGLNGASQSFTVANTTVYTVIGSNGACTDFEFATITVNQIPTISISDATICSGTSTMVTASGATTYTWMPGNLNGASQTLNPASTTAYTITGANGPCTNTKVFNLNVVTCTGISKIELENGVKIFPNPTSGEISILTDKAFTGKVEIYNAIGQIVYEKDYTSMEKGRLDLSNFENGIYILKLNSVDGSKSTLRLIKE
ncbi:MAG: T9SS type A sorting domain-containing protein [Bacteroidia bacterium]